jgi:hypothetical protein
MPNLFFKIEILDTVLCMSREGLLVEAQRPQYIPDLSKTQLNFMNLKNY